MPQVPEMVKISLHRKQLFDYIHKELSPKNVLRAPKTLRWWIIVIIILVFLFFSILLFPLLKILYVFAISIILLSFCIMRWDKAKYKYLAQKYPTYLETMDKKTAYIEFFECYRTDSLYKKVISLNISSNQLEADINYFQNKGIKTTQRTRTYLVTLIAFSFGIWGEFVGNNIGEGWSNISLFIFYAFVVSHAVFGINYLLQKTVFSGLNKNKEMAELLAEVKNLISLSP
ncbi:hypothetical protein PTI45_03153 [Paenibacillus nuruki]|uniref:Uncharacterized protein n=1 Tax=Paenibacillus nuruki TaxID=1886670 RepID=A0A1E3L1B7_9BACL|nr:hypothetical protein [Paenibacillus nuruki]ODP27443.1 hypothetical protein PTI45_03153 [Paenibacillus nuruki]